MTFARVKTVLVDQMGADPDAIIPETHLVDDLGFDSLDAVEFAMDLEEAFCIEIPDGVIDSIKTVQDVVNFIESQQQ